MARLTPAVMRTLDILELFLEDSTPLSAPEVGRRTGLPRTTVHELLATLVSRDYLQKDEARGSFRLGVRLLHLGNAYSARFDLLKSANDVARELSARAHETVSVAILEGAEVFYLAKIEIREFQFGVSSVGQRLPANCTALGKALLAAQPVERLPQLFPNPELLPVMTRNSINTLDVLRRELDSARLAGVAFEHEESVPGLCCVAAPVRGVDGEVQAAISVSAPLVRWEQHPEAYWAEIVRSGAAQLAEQYGFQHAE